MRARSVGRALVLLFAVSGCATPTEASRPVQERWAYTGTQRLPVVLELRGELVITHRTGERFEGSLTLLRTDPAGHVERVTGLIRGRQQASRLDFDAVVGGATVRHYGEAHGDSISGSWLDDSGAGNALVSGAFVLRGDGQ